MPDPQTQTVIFDGKPNVFPADFTPAEISAALSTMPPAAAPAPPQGSNWGGPAMVAGGQAIVPAMAKAAAEVATNPNVPRMAGTVARTATTLGALGHGAYTGNLSEIVAAPLAGWQAGKGGYFLGKGLQAVARPVAAVLDAVAPFAQSLATIGGAQSFLDLAQMANPKRTDIGTLGVSVGAPRSEADKAAHPALVNMLAGKVQDGIAALMQYGLSRVDAVKAITDRMTASQSSAASRPAAAPAPPPGPPNTVADFLQRD